MAQEAEGDQGIASRYAGDVGTDADPDVVFVEDFEATLPDILARWEDIKSEDSMSLSGDIPEAASGTSSLLMHKTPGDGTTGVALYRRILPPSGFGYERKLPRRRLHPKRSLFPRPARRAPTAWTKATTPTLELISELSKVCADQTIATTLNRLGYRTGAGDAWRVHSVQNTRYCYRLANHRNDDQWLTIEQASKVLEVSHTVVRRLIRESTLPATQVVANAPWIIARDALSLPAVASAVHAVHHGRQLPPVSAAQSQLPFKSRLS